MDWIWRKQELLLQRWIGCLDLIGMEIWFIDLAVCLLEQRGGRDRWEDGEEREDRERREGDDDSYSREKQYKIMWRNPASETIVSNMSVLLMAP
jgi:hypothetical protein